MLYTIVPIENIFAQNDSTDCSYCEKEIDGKVIQLNKDNNGKYSVVRIMSTEPSAYLNKKLQPNSYINI